MTTPLSFHSVGAFTTTSANGTPAAESRRLTICYPMAGDSLGGSHASLKGLLTELDSCRYQVIVVPERPGGTLSTFFADFEQHADPGAPDASLPPGRSIGLGKFLGTFSSLAPRVRLLRELEIDIVHTNDGRSHASWALAAKLAGCKLVWHHRGSPQARGLRLVAPLLADQIVTVSSFASPAGRLGAAARPKVIFSPFDVTISADRGACRKRMIDELNCDPDTLLIGFFGSFVERKRPLLFIDTIARLSKRLERPVMGLLFGEAKHPEQHGKMLEKISNGGLEGSVRIMGFRSPGHEWIAGTDILFVPAIDEPLGRTLVEAMLVGTPIVASASGGNPEALEGGCGVLCPPENAEEMATAIVELVKSPARSKAMTDRAAASARRRFSSDRHGREVMALYDGLAR